MLSKKYLLSARFVSALVESGPECLDYLLYYTYQSNPFKGIDCCSEVQRQLLPRSHVMPGGNLRKILGGIVHHDAHSDGHHNIGDGGKWSQVLEIPHHAGEQNWDQHEYHVDGQVYLDAVLIADLETNLILTLLLFYKK
jgi:hypothetical protein